MTLINVSLCDDTLGHFSLVKIAMMVVAYEQGGDWKEVLIQSWTTEDMALLTMILTFWFVGRVWEKYSKQ